MSTRQSGLLTVITFVVAIVALLLASLNYMGAPKEPVEAVQEAAAPPAAEVVHKVVYHADFRDPRRFSAMLVSINNMIKTYIDSLEEYDVRIVFVAHGIRFLTDDALSGTPFEEDAEFRSQRGELMDRIKSLQEVRGVKLELCNITREAANLDEDRLMSGTELVPSGVVRIAELQGQGFAYIKVE